MSNIITDDTLILAIDLQGGLCDRIMKGRLGIVNNANASLECWNSNINSWNDEDNKPYDLINTDNITDDDIDHALNILSIDNFLTLFITNKPIVTDKLIVGRGIIEHKPSNDLTIVDVEKISFENNIYRIF